MRDSIASPDALMKARKMMEGVVQHGTASSLKTSQYKIAGKTGTAQIARNKYGYDKDHPSYQASFVGYFPADAPKYSCMVVVYSPSNDVFFGGAVAAPIFKEIADKVYSNHIDLHSAPEKSDTVILAMPRVKAGQQKELKKLLATLEVPAQSTDDGAFNVSASAGSDGLILSERKIRQGIVPDVTGMGIKDAIYILENAGLRVKFNGKGNVIKQSLSPGMKIQKDELIALDLTL
jgi:cell division protein FtsI (penicillin-binding protein 3)